MTPLHLFPASIIHNQVSSNLQNFWSSIWSSIPEGKRKKDMTWQHGADRIWQYSCQEQFIMNSSHNLLSPLDLNALWSVTRHHFPSNWYQVTRVHEQKQKSFTLMTIRDNCCTSDVWALRQPHVIVFHILAICKRKQRLQDANHRWNCSCCKADKGQKRCGFRWWHFKPN